MLLHEAVKKARKDLGMSQKELATLAGVQRKQLGTLENGGNVTLATLRKILAHLPNLETFTLDAVTATVRRHVPPAEKQKAVDAAMELLGSALHNLVTALGDGTLPDDSVLKRMRQANEGLQQADALLNRGLGYTEEDVERLRQQARTDVIGQEAAAEMLATLIEATYPETGEEAPEEEPGEEDEGPS
jgi:transcriptional regulator with XRE-family HTH domain